LALTRCGFLRPVHTLAVDCLKRIHGEVEAVIARIRHAVHERCEARRFDDTLVAAHPAPAPMLTRA
jgi:hypothetical protein